MVNRTAPPSPPAGTVPGRFRGPFARWPRAADAVLAAVVVLALVLVTDTPRGELVLRPPGDLKIAAVPVFVVVGAVLYLRRRAPLAVLGVTLTGWVLMFTTPDTLIGIPVLIALYSTGRYAAEEPSRRPLRSATWRGLAGVAAADVLIVIDSRTDPATWGEVTFGFVVMFVVWYVGRRLRLRAQHAARLLAEQAAEARRIVAEERTRIARELHDVVAHRVSVMTVQAGAAKAMAAHAADGPVPEQALRAMGAVEEEGRQALAELRHLLGVLRPDNGSAGPEPQPGLADIPRLADQIRGTGVAVDLSMNGVPDGLPARVDLFAYRIVQEALTNVLKHAGPGTRAEVRLGAGARNEIVIGVRDDGGGTTALPEPSDAQHGTRGHGIVGMRERALLLGGTLDAGPRPSGGFEVVAHLPTGGEPA
ncbi:sensor histidine kinase [Spirillospora albida]|uniref:sensor histidine kinase n=1 Tax=Spirillospora albida TaxID=58123 RepID=UPI0004C04714|nr:sensor histidine kinase [Spirillospora albida]